MTKYIRTINKIIMDTSYLNENSVHNSLVLNV